MSDEGRLVAGRYRIVRKIGAGAMGAVWQAQDEVLHRTVAIKQLLLQPGLDAHEIDDARQRTMREARLAARLHHPNAITVFDVVTDHNGRPCLIMEYLKSASLAEELQERKTLQPREVAKIGAQVAAALKDAHAAGIVHRDIKPGNILLTSNGQVKITDFGISRAVDDVTVTRTGMIAGTPAYLAPEVAIGGNPGPESDIFSLGSTLYAACEGQPPFGLSQNTLSLLHAVAAGQIIPPRRSGTLTSVLAVLLHPEVRHRPTAEEAEELLAAVARGETPLGGPAEDTVLAPATGRLGGGIVGGAAYPAASQRPPSGGYYDEPASPNYVGDYGSQGYDHGYHNDGYAADTYGHDGGYEAGYAPGHELPAETGARYAAHEYTPARAHTAIADRRDYHDGYRRGEHHDAYEQAYEDGDYDEHDDDKDYVEAPREEESRHQQWRTPALIAGLVAVALVAFGWWMFSPKNSDPVGGSSNLNVTSTPAPAANPSHTTGSSSSSQSSSSSSSQSSSSTTSSSSKSQSVHPAPPDTDTPETSETTSSSSSPPSSPAGSTTGSPPSSGSVTSP